MKLIQSISAIIVALVMVAGVLIPIVNAFEESNSTYVDAESDWETWYEEYYGSSEESSASIAYGYARYIEATSVMVTFESGMFTVDITDNDSTYTYDLSVAQTLTSPLAIISNVFCASVDMDSGEYEVWYINTDNDEFSTDSEFYFDYIMMGNFVPSQGSYIQTDDCGHLIYVEMDSNVEDAEEDGSYSCDLGEVEYLLVPCYEYGDYVMPIYDLNGFIDSDFDFSEYVGLGADFQKSDYSYIWAFNTYYSAANFQTVSVVSQISTSTLSGNAIGYVHDVYSFTESTAYELNLESSDLDILSVSVTTSELYDAYEYVATFALTEDENEDSALVDLFAEIPGLYVIVPMEFVGTVESNSMLVGVLSAAMIMIVLFIVVASALMVYNRYWKA